jgi:hypothetical protein
MRMRWSGICLFVLLFGLVGCRARVATTAEDAASEDTTTHLNDKTDIVLAAWLQLPRSEQAKLVQEWSVTVEKQRETARNNVESVALLPKLHPPIVSAVFAEAAFSPEAGFSLPPYLKPGQKDAAVALHLARFGDREAALKVADAADRELLVKIDTFRGERDYPVEWTRLVALMLQNAELKLANGDADGAAELVQLHRQLRSLLDAKMASGALGAALLPRGRQALTQAAAAWREPRQNKTSLAADIDAVLADWGTIPDATPGLNAGAKKSDVVSLMRGETEGRAVVARTPNAVRRTLDLLALPLPSEGADGVLAFLDDKQTLTEWLVVYRPKLNELFPEPRQLARALVEHDYKSDEAATAPGLIRQKWKGGGLSYEVAVLTRGHVGGALARVGTAGESTTKASVVGNPRDFGVVHFERSFEQNRLGAAAELAGSTLNIKDADKLARIAQPASKFALASALLQREPNEDLLAKLTLSWPVDRNKNALSQLALSFWAAYGPARLESAEEAGGGAFFLKWHDATTKLKLSLPFEDKEPRLVVEDNQGPSNLKKRVETAAAFDERERRERLAAGKPRQRLARGVQLPSHSIDNLHLGMTSDQVRAIMPDAQSIRVQPLTDGYNVLFLNEPQEKATYWPRQLFIRFDKNRVVEIRVRYQEGPSKPGPKAPSLLDTLKAKNHEAAQELPAPWPGLWTDLPARKSQIALQWQDDLTCRIYRRDAGGSEVTLRDCPPDKPHGVELPPLRFCGRGVLGCNLGDTQSDVRRRWRVRNPLLASNGAEVLLPPSASRYDLLLVEYENGKVSKLIARQREPKTLKKQEITDALRQAWGADLDRLGFVRRQDGALGQLLQAYSYHDDRTRVRLFAQEMPEGIRLFTEWRDWPIAAKLLAAK